MTRTPAPPPAQQHNGEPFVPLSEDEGWTGPKFVDGKPVERTWRAHQVPITDFKKPEHIKQVDDWMQSYGPLELFDKGSKFRDEFAEFAPTGHRRIGMNAHGNGGELLVPLALLHFDDYAELV